MPPPLGSDARVGLARQPAVQLRSPIAGKHRMRVGIDQPWEDRPVPRLDDPRVLRQRNRALEIRRRPGEDDAAVGGRDRAVPDEIEPPLLRPAPRRRPGAGDELTAVSQDQQGARGPRKRRCSCQRARHGPSVCQRALRFSRARRRRASRLSATAPAPRAETRRPGVDDGAGPCRRNGPVRE